MGLTFHLSFYLRNHTTYAEVEVTTIIYVCSNKKSVFTTYSLFEKVKQYFKSCGHIHFFFLYFLRNLQLQIYLTTISYLRYGFKVK